MCVLERTLVEALLTKVMAVLTLKILQILVRSRFQRFIHFCLWPTAKQTQLLLLLELLLLLVFGYSRFSYCHDHVPFFRSFLCPSRYSWIDLPRSRYWSRSCRGAKARLVLFHHPNIMRMEQGVVILLVWILSKWPKILTQLCL